MWLVLAFAGILLNAPLALAGPPFVTDDPEPVAYQHYEFFLFSSGMRAGGETNSDTPAVEFDYGIIPNGRVAFIAPMTFDRSPNGPLNWGFGDPDLEFKYKFVDQDKKGWRPAIGVVPTVFLPAGDLHRNLGDGVVRTFLPMWFQKDFGDWTTYGGGGYTFNRGRGNRDFWFVGWVIQRKITDKLAVGAEVFHQSADKRGAKDQTGFNIGATYDVADHYQLLFSIGRGIQHARQTNELSWYLGLLVTGDARKLSKPSSAATSTETHDWTGFYVGATVGHAWQQAYQSDAVGYKGPIASSYLLTGLIGGVLSGFNWQIGKAVLGTEADVEAGGVTGGERVSLVGFQQRNDVRGSARVRVGVVVDRALPYLTGGVTVANFFASALGESFHQARPGWTIGGGVEYAFADNVSARLEYRHADFGGATFHPRDAYGNQYRVRVNDQALRVGLSYRFSF